MNEFRLGSRLIGDDHPPLVIAEVGINHEGDFDKAIALVDAAINAGSECVKFQCHITSAEMIPTDMKPGDISDERLWDIIERCELSEEEEIAVKRYCDQSGIIYLSTPFSREAADRLEAMGVIGYKIGSGEANNLPLIEHIARKGKPIILSTGMNDLDSIRPSVELIKNAGCPLMLMHCTSAYPTPYEHVRLGAIAELKQAFDVPVGLSDHSIGIYTCLGAVALGAAALEKHFTISKQWPGPDISLSIEPHELKMLVDGSRAVYHARGGSKNILPLEQPVIDFAYATVVSIAPIQKGELFTEANTWVKRPGTGPIPARHLTQVLGRRALADIQPNRHIQPNEIEEFSCCL
ncbi:MAG: N-acetylneuraminate synthase family protein [bacterium]|nr:N-acetylneuraminate synthase family protein [bacterium]